MKQVLHCILGDHDIPPEVYCKLEDSFDISLCSGWDQLPGENKDPKRLLKPTTPVLAFIDEPGLENLGKTIEPVILDQHSKLKRHPVLFIAPEEHLSELKSVLHNVDDFLPVGSTPEEFDFKLNRLIHLSNEYKKLERDLGEASDIALVSMAHSSELGEISRFILKSYECRTYEHLCEQLFAVMETFNLHCSALVLVDDNLTITSSQHVVTQEIKDTLLGHHKAKRLVNFGNELIVSFDRATILIHDIGKYDPVKRGRLADNMAVLGHCFDARVNGIDSEQKAEAAGKAKTMFLATMSHELRTPMNSVIGYTGRLLKKLDGRLNEREQKQLNAIKRNGDHLLSLINDILDMSKIEVGQMEIHKETVNIVALLEDIFDQLTPIAKTNHLDFQLTCSEKDVQADLDPKRFIQMVMNLVSNAIKYTKEGGVNIKLNSFEEENLGQCVGVAISDTGIGIKKDDLERLFTSFVQIDSALTRTVEGTGLGLSITQFFAKQHGGRIEVNSEEGKGSCFTLVLPRMDPH